MKKLFYLIAIILCLPFTINALETRKITVENFIEQENLYFLGIDENFNKMYFEESFYGKDSEFYKGEFNKTSEEIEASSIPSNLNFCSIGYNSDGFTSVTGCGGTTIARMVANPQNPSAYAYQIESSSGVTYTSKYIYKTAVLPESIGIAYSNNNVYALELLEGGFEYKDACKLIFTDSSGDYRIKESINFGLTTFENDSKVKIVFYDKEPTASVISELEKSKIKQVIKINDLDDAKYRYAFTDQNGNRYVYVYLNNKIYIIDETATKLIYSLDILESELSKLEFRSYDSDNNTLIVITINGETPIDNKVYVIDLNGNKLYDTREYIYFSQTCYGILSATFKQDNKIYSILFEKDGNEIYRTETENNLYLFISGSVLNLKAADHDTDKLEVGKYLLSDNKSFKILTVTKENSNPNTNDNIIYYIVLGGITLLILIGTIYYYKKKK